jgi:uncharacterized protein YciI
LSGYFLVRQAWGPEWDPSRGCRQQSGWNEHAAFIGRLSDKGNLSLGGPVGDIDGQCAVLVVRAANDDDARAMFADDPWMDRILTTASVEPWTLSIGADSLAEP